MFKRVHICLPAASRAAVNTTLQAAGMGPDNISIPLSPDGSAITFYGASGNFDDAQYLVVTGTIAAANRSETGNFRSYANGKGLAKKSS